MATLKMNGSVEDARKVSTVDRAMMYEVAQVCFAEMEQSDTDRDGVGRPPIEKLLEVLDVDGPNGRPAKRYAYEMWVVDFNLKEDGIIGVVPPRALSEIILYLFNDKVSRLVDEQPASRLRIAGVLIERRSKVRTVVSEKRHYSSIQKVMNNIGDRFPEDNIGSLAQSVDRGFEGEDRPMWVMDIQVVMYDAAQADILSGPSDRHGDHAKTPYDTYANGRFINQAPLSVRNQRAMAERVLAIIKSNAEAPPVAPAAPVATNERLQKLGRERVAKMVEDLGLDEAAGVLAADVAEVEHFVVTTPPEEPKPRLRAGR